MIASPCEQKASDFFQVLSSLCESSVDVYKYFDVKPETIKNFTVDHFLYEADDLCKSLECICGLRKMAKKSREGLLPSQLQLEAQPSSSLPDQLKAQNPADGVGEGAKVPQNSSGNAPKGLDLGAHGSGIEIEIDRSRPILMARYLKHINSNEFLNYQRVLSEGK